MMNWWTNWEKQAHGAGENEENLMWEDPEFPADDASLYIDPVKLPEYAQDTPTVEWRRPQEIWHNAEKEERAVMWRDENKLGEVKQGILDDCWLLGAFLAVAVNPSILRNLLVRDGIEYGYAVFKFFKNGEWQYIKIDTQIPYSSTTKQPLYGYCMEA
jgi:calpain